MSDMQARSSDEPTREADVRTSGTYEQYAEEHKPAPTWWRWLARKKLLAAAAIVAIGFAAVIGIGTVSGQFGSADQSLVFYTVQRGDLPITITERGSLESQQQVNIVCEVETLLDRSNANGTQILFIVPNGASVTKGELLVELDSAPLRERLDAQFLATQRAKSDFVQAKVKYDNQISQNQTTLEQAALDVKLAELDLKMYEDEDGGTFQIDLEDVELAIQEAQASRLIKQTDLKGVEMLYNLGYKSKGDLSAARLNYLSADRSLAKNVSLKRKKVEYEYEMQKLQLTGAVETTKRNYTQVERNNESLLAQAQAELENAERAMKKEEERYKRYEEQIDKCKIFAPQDGMVAYAEQNRFVRSSTGGGVIAPGEFVRERQQILSLPNMNTMQVQTAVHESVLDKARAGLPVTVRIDAFDNRSYRGTVKSVAVMPEQGSFFSSGVNVYKTIVTIDEPVEQLKPGMTAVVDIHVDVLKNVLTVPVQAIVQIGRDNWVYLESGRGTERRQVEIGRTNDKFVEIRAGLEEGDRVVLNPMAIVDDAQGKSDSGAESENAESSASDNSPATEAGGSLAPPVGNPN